MKRYSVVLYIWRTRSQVFVYGRSHEEAYEQALLSLRVKDGVVGFAEIIPAPLQ